MRLFTLFFLLGTLSIQITANLPSLIWVGLLLAVSLTLSLFLEKSFNSYKENGVIGDKKQGLGIKLKKGMLFFVAYFLGLSLAVFTAQQQLDARLPTDLEGQDIIVIGDIADIPIVTEYEQRDDSVRFRLNIKKAFTLDKHQPIALSGIVRLGWYKGYQGDKNSKPVLAGEQWQLQIRLKKPSGFMNPGGFDYEKWLFTERIIATGYVRETKNTETKNTKIKSTEEIDIVSNNNKRLSTAPWWSINAIRQSIHENIQLKVMNKSSAAVLSALAVADRSKLEQEQWQMLQQTGTSHLVAISGLHIAIVAGFGFLPVLFLWSLFPSLNEVVPVRVAGGVIGILFAGAYALLAGFSLPTQRALLMVIIALLALISRKNYASSSILAIALLAVLILDPLAGMTVSFWLSFLAVSIILIIAKRQFADVDVAAGVKNVKGVKGKKSRLQSLIGLGKLQLLLSLGMFPLSLLFFNTASLSSPIANLIAIPWVSFIVVPLTLLGVLFMPLISTVSDALFNIASLAVEYLLQGLSFLSEQSLFAVNLPEIPLAYLFFAFIGFLFVLLPKGFPARWLGIIAVLPAILFSPQKPEQNEFFYTLLDAGQGMASVVQTQNHTLIYDTGKRVSESYDIGRLVVVPFLKSKGFNKIDVMMVSHEDNDHSGGAQTILESIAVDSIQSSDLSILPDHKVTFCKAGEHWQWDGVDFEVLSPSQDWLENNTQYKDNNLSCVLRVSNKTHSLLLTGDIEKLAEKVLLKNHKEKLASDVIIVPHHGSKTSSTESFIKATNPKIALIPAGYRNRFGHPKATILSRYLDKNIRVMDTIEYGALELKFPANNNNIDIKSWRKENSGFWSR